MNEKERIELHCHSTFGGNATMYPGEIIRYLSEKGMPAFALTDESSITAYTELEEVWETGEYISRPIYGMEMPVSDCDETFSISVLVKNEIGKINLYKMVSNNDSVEPFPCFAITDLLKNREGLLIGSGTDKGRVYRLASNQLSDEEIKKEFSIYDYIEVLPFKEFESATKRIIKLSDELGIPVVAVSDARYADNTGRKALHIMNHWNGVKEKALQNHFWSTQEMKDAFYYLPEDTVNRIVVENTHKIADMCETVSICPKEKYYPVIDDAENKLYTLCVESISQKYSDCIQKATERLEWELTALKNTGMESYMLIIKDLLKISCLKACDISLRGVAAGSIVAYLLGITEIDSLKYGLEPELIYGFNQQREIDIDINLPANRQAEVHSLLEKVDGIKKTVLGGTIHYIDDNLAEAMISRYEIDSEVYFEEEIRNKLRWCISGNYLGRAKHPGGLIVFPEGCDYEKYSPIARTAEGIEITHFDYHQMSKSFLKIDLLMHNSPEMLTKLSERTGIEIASIPTDCEEVLQLFKPNEEGMLVGCSDLPEFKTDYVKNVVTLLKPNCFNDLVKITGLIHGSNTWDETGEKLVNENGLGIKEIIADRDDVFEYNLSLGLDRKTSFEIAEAVRKGIVARGKNAKWQGWKKKLMEAGAPEWYLWTCEQIRYLFPRAHAISYVSMTMRLGWFKIHYPNDFTAVIKEYEDAM